MKTIAVLLSSYNGQKYIRCQIDSILGQRLKDVHLRLFIRDDGSSDSTKEILKEYEENNSNVTVFYGENVGCVYSFFDLLNKVRMYDCDYIALSDQDDRWDCDKLQIGIDYVKNKKGPFLYESTVRVTDSELRFKKIDQLNRRPIVFFNSAIQTFSPGHTYVFNKELLVEIKDNIDCSRIYVHDSFIHNIAVIKGRVFFDRTPHNDYRQHDSNIIGESQKKGIFGWISIRLKRIGRKENKAYAKQMHYYLDYFGEALKPEYRNELTRFFSFQKNFFTRLAYIFKTKFYRQARLETLAFKLLYLFGGYNYKE